MYRVLSNERRRDCLRYLRQASETATVDELSDHLREADGDPERVRVALHHVHLPQLADAGLLTWDRAGGTVALESLAHRLPAGAVSPTRPPQAPQSEGEQTSD